MGYFPIFQGDTIVCSTSTKLNLNSGAAHSLLKHGGQNLQDECKKVYPEGIKNGELAVINGGKLKCTKVYLTALPEWKDANGGKVRVLTFVCHKSSHLKTTRGW